MAFILTTYLCVVSNQRQTFKMNLFSFTVFIIFPFVRQDGGKMECEGRVGVNDPFMIMSTDDQNEGPAAGCILSALFMAKCLDTWSPSEPGSATYGPEPLYPAHKPRAFASRRLQQCFGLCLHHSCTVSAARLEGLAHLGMSCVILAYHSWCTANPCFRVCKGTLEFLNIKGPYKACLKNS